MMSFTVTDDNFTIIEDGECALESKITMTLEFH